jgi:hypothetical protein
MKLLCHRISTPTRQFLSRLPLLLENFNSHHLFLLERFQLPFGMTPLPPRRVDAAKSSAIAKGGLGREKHIEKNLSR